MPTDPDHDALALALARMGLIAPGEVFAVTRLAGGVSCDVWKVDRPGTGSLVVKKALEKLRVAADWRAPPRRWKAEVAWLKLAHAIDPATAPAIVGEDEEAGLFAMAFLGHCPLWKAELAAGRIDVAFAAVTGRKLSRIHAATAARADIAAQFDNGAQFHALRLEPYLLFTASRHPDVAPQIQSIAGGIAAARIALMQGDISPKNILVGHDGPVFLDAETACYGDPVFDFAFCLNHLLLKCVWHPEHADKYLASFRAMKDAYLKGVSWEPAAAVEARTARLLAALLLARIDGKSPVEYLTDAGDRDFVREAAKGFIKSGEESLEAMATAWSKKLAARAHPSTGSG